jgi:RimJ/RimL family protein N-acetyltransferase
MLISISYAFTIKRGPMVPISRNEQTMPFTFQPVTEKDLPLLYQWFQEPHVTQWWPVPKQEEDFFEHFLKRIRSKDTFPFMVLLNGKPIGYIQYYPLDISNNQWLPPMPSTTIGTDQFIGDPNYLGKGYGTHFLKAFIDYLTCTLAADITTIIVDPDPTNYAAIKCYEKVGFKHMGTYSAPWGPALLMRYDIQKST